jgi:hypothetical protein
VQSRTISRSGYQAAKIILVSFAVLMSAILIMLFATDRTGSDTHPSDSVRTALGHVHGLGVDPGDDTLYIATHTGVFSFDDEGLERVADRWQDTMGFAVVGPEHFLASGHPDLREDLPSMLGLIESTDGAETWQPLSLVGEADLHAIEPTEDIVYAIDALEGRLIASADRRDWRTVDERPLLDLAVLATSTGNELLATTPGGELLRYEEAGQASSAIGGAPPLAYIDGARPNLLVGANAGGDVFISATGDSWQQVGTVVGHVTALDAGPGAWHVATEGGVFTSTDAGKTWTLLVEIA